MSDTDPGTCVPLSSGVVPDIGMSCAMHPWMVPAGVLEGSPAPMPANGKALEAVGTAIAALAAASRFSA